MKKMTENTLLIPCGGKSSRFPGMKPKYLLTHPDGKIMIEKAICGINQDIFDRIIITIIKEHNEQYNSELILKQIFNNNKKIEICILDDFTKSASETVFLTIKKMNITGSLVIKDCDNLVEINISKDIQNGIIGYDLHKHPNISNIPGKSFLTINQNNTIKDIMEKQIVSNIICLGVYCFKNVDDFIIAYNQLNQRNSTGEMFISHIISYLLSNKKYIFQYIEALNYEDYGTLNEWKNLQKNFRTYFCDVDGVILKNCGKYGKTNWNNSKTILEENVNEIIKLQENGAQIVITTSRTEEYRKDLEKILQDIGIKPYTIIMGLNHAARIIINDFAPTNPYPSGIAITLPRDANLKDYLTN